MKSHAGTFAHVKNLFFLNYTSISQVKTSESTINLIVTCVDVVVFDNSFSYLRSKKLWYRFTVANPTAEEIATYGEFNGV